MRRVLLFAFCALFAQFAMAQKTVTGTVSSDEGPLEGVTVLAKGTTIGGFTDSRGQFSLEVPNAVEVLVFSYIGYKEESVDLAGKNNVSVNMTQESILDEVVITGVSQGRSTTK
ncbi:MAG: carboxypeptidase-like regulatory domain-containing protein, partial [Bacteroidota bacterium]